MKASVVGLALSLLVAVPAAGSAHQAPPSNTTTVTAAGGPLPFTWAWDPAEVSIARGEKVTWTNPTDAAHHVTAWEGKWDAAEHLDMGSKVTLRFKKPGVYKYWCDILGHADIVFVGTERVCVGMCGVIRVE